jgi:HlyD family secretion protein
VVTDSGEVLKIPNQALRFRPADAGSRGDRADRPPTGGGAKGNPATVWTLGPDGSPTPVRISTGVADDNTTAMLAGELKEGQPLIVGVAASQKTGGVFGLRLGL